MEIFYSSSEDIENLVGILRRLEEICFPFDPWNSKLIHSHLKSHSSILAKEGDTILGYCLFAQTHFELEIYRFGVIPNFRNQGVGKFILNEVFQLAKDRQIYLEVDDKNFQAIQFYEKYGFQLLDKRKAYYQNGNDALLYIRKPVR